MTVVLVAIGGAVGAILRYFITVWVQRAHRSAFPWGTLVVNISGSLVLGFLTALALRGAESGEVSALLGTGLCGALTTYSTFAYETAQLFTLRARWFAVTNIVLSVFACFGAALTGITIALAVLS